MKRTKEQNRKQGKASRRKGAEGELEASKLWHPWFPHCKRMFPLQQQGVKFPDIGCPKMNELFYVEVKRQKRISDAQVSRFWVKTENDWYKYVEEFNPALNDPEPIIMFREDGKDWQIAINPETDALSQWTKKETAEGDGYIVDRCGVRSRITIIPWSDFEKYLNKHFTVTEVRGE